MEKDLEVLESEGFEFNPNDAVMVKYLLKLIDGHMFTEKRINCIDLYDHSPQSLVSFPSHGGVKWYFYTRLNQKYFGGTKPIRKTKEGGVWKCKKTYRIRDKGNEIGLRRVLKYTEKGGHETEWVLWEYTATKKNQSALCKLFKKACKRARVAGSSNSNTAQGNEDVDVETRLSYVANSVSSIDTCLVGTSHALATSSNEEARVLGTSHVGLVADGTSYGLNVDVPEAGGAVDNRQTVSSEVGPLRDIAYGLPDSQLFLAGSSLAGELIPLEEARVVDISAPHLDIAESRSYGLVSDVSEARGAETFHTNDGSVAVGTSHIGSLSPPSDIAEGTSSGLIPDVSEDRGAAERMHSMSCEIEGFDLGSVDEQSLCLSQFGSQEFQVATELVDTGTTHVDSSTSRWDVAESRSFGLNSDVSEVRGAETTGGEGTVDHVQILGAQKFGLERVLGCSLIRGELIDDGQFWAEIDERQQNEADPVVMHSADKWILEAQLLW